MRERFQDRDEQLSSKGTWKRITNSRSYGRGDARNQKIGVKYDFHEAVTG